MYAGAGDHLRAGMVLSAARLSSEALKREDRARAYVRCAQAYNRVDDDVNAESAVRKASELQEAMDPLLRLQFKAAFAQVTDAKRRFVEAASKYLDVLRHAPPGVSAFCSCESQTTVEGLVLRAYSGHHSLLGVSVFPLLFADMT